MAPRLILRPQTPDEQILELTEGSTSIGRTRDNDVFVLHKSLSRAHAKIEVTGETIVVSDLGSKNGTFVDGQRIQRLALREAHALKFGDIPATFARTPGAQPLIATPAPTMIRDMAGDVTRMSMLDLMAGPATMGPAMVRMRSEPAPDRDRARLRILLKVSQLLSSPSSLDALLSSVLDLAFELLDIDRAAILMLDATGQLVPKNVRDKQGATDAGASFSTSVARYVVDRNVAALFGDAQSDPRLAEAGSVIAQSIHTSMCAPLAPTDKVLGVLYVDNRTRIHQFDKEDLEFLCAFANQAGVAIENSILSDQLAQEAVTRNTMQRFFPPAALPAIMKSGLVTIETEATVLFADISAFTEMSARMKPVEIIALLNAYFPGMAEIVFRLEGTLEKYIGDALLAVWGAPLKQADDAVRAVRAALEMQRAMADLRARLPMFEGVEIHIGVNTGFVAAGNIGSNEYVQYATIGDTTNVAARICSVAQSGQVVIDERTAQRLDAAEFKLTALGRVPLKGKAEPEPLFRVE